jgi:hypothetical protein
MFFGGKAGNYVGSQGQQALFGGGGSPGDPYGGMAQYPTYVGMTPEQTALAHQFQGQNPAMDQFVNESMRSGPSRGAQFALQQNALGANRSREQARKLAGGMAQNAQANLSMKGGMGAGARERIQKQAGNAALDFSNAADANASQSRANLLISDEAMRGGNLAKAGGMLQGQNAFRYGMASDDMQRKQGEYDRRNLFNMNLYNKQMEAWGAGKQADATANSGKK